MKMTHYILDEKGQVKEEPDLMKWATWFEANREARVIGQMDVGEYTVSTVFLGLDHNFFNEGEPILFETLVFGKEPVEVQILNRKRLVYKTVDNDGWGGRWCTREEAEENHAKIIEAVESFQREPEPEEPEEPEEVEELNEEEHE